MLDQVLSEYQKSSYDFRVYAYPQDPLHHLFDDWVEYYKLKWAIAKVIQPKSILEIGVRYGYSAFAFLDAAPNAKYVGIDANIEHYGGVHNAMEWAKSSLSKKDAEFIEANSQELTGFPGEQYDLIHVDGQQDGDGFYRDMVKAIKKARYVLVDGALWTELNAQASVAFLKDYKASIDWSINFSGYAGELLIKVKHQKHASDNISSSNDIVELYESDYYLTDCGGFQEFNKSGGRELTDIRLSSMFLLADVKSGDFVVDAGCGRGELTCALAKSGASVLGIDYSQSAIDISTEVLKPEIQSQKVRLLRSDITCADLGNNVNRIVAADLIEHLMPDELEKMYANFSESLSDEGQFIVHTFPNKWFYQFGYERKRRSVKKIGGFISPEPRTHYERLMHINEQSPRILKQQLKKHFNYVMLWFASPDDTVGSLDRNFSLSECMFARDLYAVASNSPISKKSIVERLRQQVLSPQQRKQVELTSKVIEVVPNSHIAVDVEITNNSDVKLSSTSKYAVHISYHWFKDDELFLFEGNRTMIPIILQGTKKEVRCNIVIPTEPGLFKLQVTLVQEQVAWFENHSQILDVRLD